MRSLCFRLGMPLACALLLSACGDGFEGGAASGQGGGGNAGTGASTGQGNGGGPAPEVGCSDGQRELFEDPGGEPNVAGCAGAFDVPGVIRPESLTPQCARQAGDDGKAADGAGCSVADFCAEGWHVCASQVEFAQKSSNGCPSATAATALTFWLTRQAQDAMGQCATGTTIVNNVAGCGYDYGLAAHTTCAPLNRVLRWESCQETSAWSCGDMNQPNDEAQSIHKTSPNEGGVLCCRD